MWIGSQKGSKDKTMGFKCITEPIKALGAFLSYDGDKNNEENFFSKIRTFGKHAISHCTVVQCWRRQCVSLN